VSGRVTGPAAGSPDVVAGAVPDRDARGGSAPDGNGGGRGAAARGAGRPGEGSGAGAGPGPGHSPWRAAFFALAGAAIVAGVGWALLGSRFLVVRSIQVTGTHLVTRSQVLAAAGIEPGVPLIRVNPAAVAHRVERITQVQSATVARGWPDSVRISVRERTPVLAVASGRGYQLIDRFGVAVQRAARPPRGMPQLTLPGAAGSIAVLRGSPAVYAAAVVVRQLPRRIARRVATVSAPEASEVTLKLADGVRVVWGGTDRPAAKAKELALLMRTHARSYDVSAPQTAVTGG